MGEADIRRGTATRGILLLPRGRDGSLGATGRIAGIASAIGSSQQWLIPLSSFSSGPMVTIWKNESFNFESNTHFDLNELSDKCAYECRLPRNSGTGGLLDPPMSNDIKVAGLLSNALLPSRRDRGWPNTARLPWWVSEEIVNFGRAETMAINASLESDFLVVRPTPFPERANESRHLFYKFLDGVLRMIQMPRIRDAQA
jgi:hypothetical protein